MSSADFRAARARAGFTLIELLISMVIGVLLAGIIFELMRGQGRFVTSQSTRQDVQQNARGALEVLTSELRGAPVQGIEEAGDTTITFRVPRAWGIYCGGSNATLSAIFSNLDDGTYTPGTATGVMVNTAGTTWEADGVSAAATFSVAGAGNECSDVRDTSLGNATADGVAFTAAAGSSFPTPSVGQPLFLYDRVKYDVGDGPTGTSEVWIRRSNGVAGGSFSMQPLAGPVPAGGLRFTYYNSAGAEIAAPGTNAANLLLVRRIKVRVSSTRTREGVTHTQVDSLSIHIRNREQ